VKILITGGAGFVGTHMAIRLKSIGHTPILVDFENQYTNFHRETFKTYGLDISNRENLFSIKEDISLIVHCAALSGVTVSNLSPDNCIDWNIKGTLNVCELAKKKECHKVIYTSTMAVYGEGDNLKEQDVLYPVSNYAISKLTGEHFIKLLPFHGIDYTIFRLFNTYGPGQDIKDFTQGIVSVFLGQSICRKNIQVTGSLERYRDLIYIDDVVDAIEMSLFSDSLKQECYNLCNNEKVTIKRLINVILDVHDDPKESFIVEDIGSHEGDQSGVYGSNSLLKSKGWNPKINLRDGIRKFYNHSKNIKSREEGWRKLAN
jgi:UDP-glucose 4-epimerase